MNQETRADQEPQAQPAESDARPKAKGRGLALLALLVGVMALLGAGFIYYQLIYLAPAQSVSERITSLEGATAGYAQELQALRDAQRESLETLDARQRQRLEAFEQAMASALSEVSRASGPVPKQWKLAEVEYLLRIANHRVLMERDVDAARRLLSAADAILLQLDDFALHPVRAALADEILALRSVRGNDVQGVYLRLEAIKGRLATLPLELPEYFVPAGAPPAEAAQAGFWQTLSAQLEKYLQVRRFEGTRKPLLAPEEAVYLELNLRLMLERAQLAALRRQQMVYEQSLGSVQEWLLEYLDAQNAMVQEVVEETDALLEVRLDQSLPDISGSLSALLAAREGEP